MDGLTPVSIASALAASAVLSLLVLWLLGRSWQTTERAFQDHDGPTARSASFLFHDNALVDQDAHPGPLPGLAPNDIRDWPDLRQWLGNRFGPLPGSLSDLKDGELRDLPATDVDDIASLTLSRRREMGRVEVTEPAEPDPLEQHRARCLDDALHRYQAVLDRAPCAVRITGKAGETIWQNKIFASYTEEDAQLLLDAAKKADTAIRVRLPGQQSAQDRFLEVEDIRLGDAGIVYATDVTQVARAEMVRREFIQTLTKTFANLTTGLAVFDRHRRLALFNPALLDLTGLPAPFLSTQPPLMQFFDCLRDNKVLPEPKNYRTWRKQIEDMITSASDGLYLEDWHLPNGMTYRVTGRPHPDGAIAFLFEDITDNVSLARRFRSQITLREAVLDASDQAKVVFGPENIVTLCNLTCREMLGIDPDASFADMTLRDFLSVCEKTLPDDRFWKEVEQTVLARGRMDELLSQEDGTTYICHVMPLPGNSAIITLRTPQLASLTSKKAESERQA